MTTDKTRVFEVCDALASQGLSDVVITNAAVRAALGGRGSFSTLAPLIRMWKEARAAVRIRATEPLPSALGAQNTRLLDALWTSALASARDTAQREASEALASAHASVSEALGEVARLESEATRLTTEHATALSAAEAARQSSDGLRSQLGAAIERAAQAEARGTEERAARETVTAQRDAAREEAAELRGMLKAQQTLQTTPTKGKA